MASPYSFKSDGFSSTTRVIDTWLRAEVIDDTSVSSALIASGWVICQLPFFLTTVVWSPFSALTLTSSILSDSSDVNTFSCFEVASAVSERFQVTK